MSGEAAMTAVAPFRFAQGWRTHLVVLGIAVAALLALFARDVVDMAAIWWTSSTYEHCLVIVPIIAWLVAQRRSVLAEVTPRGWPVALAWVAIGGLSWLLGQAAGVAVARHLGLILMLQGLVAATLGRGVTAGLLFPLFYAIFLVPAGDGLVPPLQTITAWMCLGLLHAIHVPAVLDGVFISTPGGWFKVAEACSGAKFLIAMIALGVLVAHLGFRNWWRRAAFMLVCVVVPVLANGARAFGTIWVAQYRGAVAADGFDHVVYGWFFFAAVIALVMALSWRFFDRAADAPAVDRDVVLREVARQRSIAAPIPMALAALAIAGAAPLWSAVVVATGVAPIPVGARLPVVAGWTPIAAGDGVAWKPRFDGADRLLIQRYRDAANEQVDLAVAIYAGQERGRSLVGYGHGAVDPDGDWSWAADTMAPADGNAERIVAPGAVSREVVGFYRIGAMVTGSPAHVKIETLRRHLLGGSQRASALLVSAEDARGGRAAVDRFVAALGPIGPALDHIAEGR
jgi:exosortase A